jgi:hypothetical protein
VASAPADQASEGYAMPCQVFGSADLGDPLALLPLAASRNGRSAAAVTGVMQEAISHCRLAQRRQEPTTHLRDPEFRTQRCMQEQNFLETPKIRRTSTKHLSSAAAFKRQLRVVVI